MCEKKRIRKIALGVALWLGIMLCGCQAGQEAGGSRTGEAEGLQSTINAGEESPMEEEGDQSVQDSDETQNSPEKTELETSAGDDGGETTEPETSAGDDGGETTELEKSAYDSGEALALKDACADYFTLGVGINGSTLDNLTTYTPEYMELVKEHFNSVTMTNLMKSAYLLQQQESQKSADGSPVLDYTCIDDTLQWCMDNGVGMRGHTLVWHTQTPGWFFREGYEDKGDLVDKDTMLFRMESYIRQLMEHVQENYPGVVYCWDVVNEAVDPGAGDPDSFFSCRMKNGEEANLWYETIGPEYVEYAFTYARKYADEDVRLFYNDFNTYENAKRNYIYLLCEDLKEKGLIDGIGMQGYWGVDYPNISVIVQTITQFAQLDLEIQITELSVGVEEETEEAFEKQAKRYRNIFYELKGLDTAGGGKANITNVTFFGLIDHYTAADKTNARLFDQYYQPKAAFKEVQDVFIKEYQEQ